MLICCFVTLSICCASIRATRATSATCLLFPSGNSYLSHNCFAWSCVGIIPKYLSSGVSSTSYQMSQTEYAFLPTRPQANNQCNPGLFPDTDGAQIGVFAYAH